jgi:hypothetical protein
MAVFKGNATAACRKEVLRASSAAALAAFLAASGWSPSWAQEADRRLAKGIQDNSFLIEEAYNQEPGVVQHIATLQRQGNSWFFGFTQEWPVVSQTHQFSYTVPYAWLREDGMSAQGFGDVMFNYRWQALTEDASAPAVAPRLSLILPSGDADRNLGTGSAGLQFNLPVSKIVSDRVTLHANVGLTHFFDVQGRSPTSHHLGASVVYAVRRDFNLMLEALGQWTETVDAGGAAARETTLTLSPGFRQAFDLSPAQLVVGVALPMRLGAGEPDYGVFLYISLEHSFLGK